MGSRQLDLWYLRSSSGYSGKGAKPTGWEHHEITITSVIEVASEVRFHNFGAQHYLVTARGGKRPSSTYSNPRRRVSVTSRVESRRWASRIEDVQRLAEVAVELEADPVPSVVARFLPLLGEAATGDFHLVAEDASPKWKPLGKQSWFPIAGIGGVGVRRWQRGAPEPASGGAVRWDLMGGTEAWASAWLADRELIRYQHPGCVLTLSDERTCRRLDG